MQTKCTEPFNNNWRRMRVHRPSGHSEGICTYADEVHGIRPPTRRQNFSRIQICSTAVSSRRVDQEHSLTGPHRSAVSFSPQLDATHPLLDRNCCFDAGTFSSSSHHNMRSSDPTSRANCPNVRGVWRESRVLLYFLRFIVQSFKTIATAQR